MPNIGHGSDEKTRHYLPNGFKKFVVHNTSELDILLMHNRYNARQQNSFAYSIFSYSVFPLLTSFSYSQDLLCRDCS